MAEPTFSRIKVLQSNSSSIYYKISYFILSFAVLGYTDVACRLLSQLNTHDKQHGHHQILRPLWLLWDTLDTWPEGEHQRAYDSIKEEQERNTRFGTNDGSKPARKQAKLDEDEIQANITEENLKKEIDTMARSYIEGWWRPTKYMDNAPKDTDNLAADEQRDWIQKTLKTIDEMKPEEFKNAQSGAMAMDVSSGLVRALDLALSLEGSGVETAPAPSSQEILEMIAKRMSANQQIEFLVQSRLAWGILKDGALAQILQLDTKKVDGFAKDFQGVIEERFRNGKQSLQDLSMRQILELLDDIALHNPEAQAETMADRPTESLFRKPATDEQIKEAEVELGIELPDDYKELLTMSNGFGTMWGGILYEPGLHEVNDIRWFDDSEDYFIDLGFDLLPDCDFESLLENYPLTVGKAIEIGTEDIYNTWLIPPSTVNTFKSFVRRVLAGEEEAEEDARESIRKSIINFAGSEENFYNLGWCCMTWACGGVATMVGYPSLKAYLRGLVEDGQKEDGDLVFGDEWWAYAFSKLEKEA